jgi:alkanesulfonate monooxygenase SsuD/methylene tetrahydromethanopterin reductase-like flavin-dependent oxidoreductase (luciferase family)
VVPTIVGDDIAGCADLLRPMYALYIGGMGARDANFHFDVFSRLGYDDACHKIQDAYLDGRKADAIAAVPTALIEDVCLIGPKEKVLDDLEAWRETVITTMLVSGPPSLLEDIAALVG